MATLSYRDPVSGLWVELDGPTGPVGAAGPAGATGPREVSADLNNTAVISTTDGLVFVPGVNTTALDTDFVNLTGDTMTGELSLPDQIATPPSAATTVAARGYVDQVITVSDVDPVAAPVRDGLIWNVIGLEIPGYGQSITTYGTGTYGQVAT